MREWLATTLGEAFRLAFLRLLGLFLPVSVVSLSPFLSSCRKRAPITAGWLVGACKEEMDPLPSPRKISNSSDCLSSNLDFSDHKGDMHFSDRKGDMHFTD
jgi:hypothetical protein